MGCAEFEVTVVLKDRISAAAEDRLKRNGEEHRRWVRGSQNLFSSCCRKGVGKARQRARAQPLIRRPL